jgi:DNA adenine methylase
MSWPGGKDGAGVAQRLINEIPPHDVFISPFLGDCAILRRKRPAAISIGIDLDRANIDRWARAQPVPRLQLYHCDGIEWLRHAFDFYSVAIAAKKSGRRSTAAASGAADVSDAKSRGRVDPAAESRDPTRLFARAPHNSATGSRVAVLGDGRRRFVYIDPPYLFATRRSQRPIYANEMSDRDHERLLATAVALPCMVMVSHYPHPLYAEALAHWRTFTYTAQTRGGGKATEQVWCNFPEPEELHDARYLGRNKREREKIRRRVRNWTAGLARMKPLERQAVLDSLCRDAESSDVGRAAAGAEMGDR